MNRTFPTFLTLLLIAVFAPGCAVMRYTRTPFMVGTNRFQHVTFSAYMFLEDGKVSKLTIDKVTKTGTTGASIGAAEAEVDNEAVQAITAGVVEGVIKGIK